MALRFLSCPHTIFSFVPLLSPWLLYVTNLFRKHSSLKYTLPHTDSASEALREHKCHMYLSVSPCLFLCCVCTCVIIYLLLCMYVYANVCILACVHVHVFLHVWCLPRYITLGVPSSLIPIRILSPITMIKSLSQCQFAPLEHCPVLQQGVSPNFSKCFPQTHSKDVWTMWDQEHSSFVSMAQP